MTDGYAHWSPWTRFWHAPVRAERLGLARVLFGVALLTDQLCQLWPNFHDFYGPQGVAPQGLHDAYMLRTWHWSVLLFNTDHLPTLYAAFAAWVAVTALFTLGWQTNIMKVLVWFLTMCWQARNPVLLIGADDTLAMGLFWLMLSPCGRGLSLDARRRRHRHPGEPPPTTPAWPVRLMQIQLCVIYASTGIAKLRGETWWEGTSIHYALNYVTMTRWSFAQFPLPLWVTAPMSYACVSWEILFPLLVLFRRTRPWALWFGILFHIGIWLTIEVGWFSFYTMALYGVWVPDRWWETRSGLGTRDSGSAAEGQPPGGAATDSSHRVCATD